MLSSGSFFPFHARNRWLKLGSLGAWPAGGRPGPRPRLRPRVLACGRSAPASRPAGLLVYGPSHGDRSRCRKRLLKGCQLRRRPYPAPGRPGSAPAAAGGGAGAALSPGPTCVHGRCAPLRLCHSAPGDTAVGQLRRVYDSLPTAGPRREARPAGPPLRLPRLSVRALHHCGRNRPAIRQQLSPMDRRDVTHQRDTGECALRRTWTAET